MPNRAWFYAEGGQQQGPFPDAQFRDLIARGIIRPDTQVWTDGMAGWQKAGDIPGLFSAARRPPAMPGRMPSAAGASSGALSIDFEILDFVRQALIFVVGSLLVIPLPWVLVSTLKWAVARTRVPGRPGLSFAGKVETILWWYFGAMAAIIVLGFIGGRIAHLISFVIEVGLGWLAIQWFIASLASSDEQPLGLRFSGSFLPYLGWHALGALSTITIVGWAWVYTAQTRWIFRNIEGARREITFKATGLEYLWRAIVTAIGCAFIIPIPWVVPWMMGWVASQIVLVPRGAQAA
jgi:heme/copper-type cytochrome/quinol oxidase subunit 2